MNTFGRNFRVSIFGESHNSAVGVVIDGVPCGLPLTAESFTDDLERRRSGAFGTTARKEDDIPEILSGTYDGCTTGAPLCLIFRNDDIRSSDYSMFSSIPRPGHSDFTASVKYNFFNDIRGGGHFSGRLTLGLVAAGTVARMVTEGCSISAELIEAGGMTDRIGIEKAIESAMQDGDSVGGIVECTCRGIRTGLGEPFFDSVESMISHIVFSIPGVRGIEFGDGFNAARMKGSEHNDCFTDSRGRTGRNGCGGINGGISNGNDIVFRVAFKPTSSISKPQYTYDFVNERMTELKIPGRHDTCFALRTPVIVESAAAIALADLLLTFRD